MDDLTRVESEKKAAMFVEAWLHPANLIRWDGPIVRPAVEKALADLLDAECERDAQSRGDYGNKLLRDALGRMEAECAAQAATIARLRAALAWLVPVSTHEPDSMHGIGRCPKCEAERVLTDPDAGQDYADAVRALVEAAEEVLNMEPTEDMRPSDFIDLANALAQARRAGVA